MIEVLGGGVYTLVQDHGRPGFYAMGLPPSGAMDMYSHDVANVLVGNDERAASLEITVRGPILKFTDAGVVAVTGGTMDLALDGEPVESWTTLTVGQGQTLAMSRLREGVRAYLAVRGGIDVPPVLGSRSTYAACALGGVNGRQLQRGDLIAVGGDVARASPRMGTSVPESSRPIHRTESEIRAVRGLCDYRLTDAGVSRLFGTPFEVSHESNRTGYRLRGTPLEFVARKPPFGAGSDPSNVVDLGYPIGSIQAPAGGELICVHRDAVTGGGYVTIATVISADLDVIAQCKAGDLVTFVPVSIESALAARRSARARLRQVTAAATL
jgi:biotin-dependent carboxylase-like uncharacterized protein